MSQAGPARGEVLGLLSKSVTMPRDRARLVILGTGFAAFSVLQGVNPKFYAVTVVSPRNHFLFTPLLTSTTVGTIEFRSIIEPARYVSPRFFQAACTGIDPAARRITCRNDVEFTLDYDLLVIAVGSVNSTFGIPGVADHALFLKELDDARRIRQSVLQALESASLPGLTLEERARRVQFVICGGGPTGVEFAAELHDLLFAEARRYFPDLARLARITVVEAGPEILTAFDEKLRRYAWEVFERQRIEVRTRAPVVRVEHDSIELQGGERISYGLLVWSAGVGPAELVRNLPFEKDGRSRLLTDDYFRVLGCPDIYALGDCATLAGQNLPATAQVAMKEGRYLAQALNRRAQGKKVAPFEYSHLGMLAYLGGNRALADLPNFKGAGWAAWLFWRSAYLTRLLSWKNKAQVLFDWVKAQIFGRDISRF
jgi:NADH:ubiquinone reductase (non-electrogenic)